jgi:hypothetical protein
MSTAEKPDLPLTVYYDKSCPLCATEIHALRDLDPKGFRLVDCSAPDFADAMRDDMMARMHARDAQGRWLTGWTPSRRSTRPPAEAYVAAMGKPEPAPGVRPDVCLDRAQPAGAVAPRVASRGSGCCWAAATLQRWPVLELDPGRRGRTLGTNTRQFLPRRGRARQTRHVGLPWLEIALFVPLPAASRELPQGVVAFRIVAAQRAAARFIGFLGLAEGEHRGLTVRQNGLA